MASSCYVLPTRHILSLEQFQSLNRLYEQIHVTKNSAVQAARNKVIELLAETSLLQPQLSALLSRLDEYQVRVIDRREWDCSQRLPNVQSELQHLIALDTQVKAMQDIQDLKQRESSLRRVENQVSEMVSKNVWKPFAAQFTSIQQHLSRFKSRCATLDAQRMKLNCYGLRQLIHSLTKDMWAEHKAELTRPGYDSYLQKCLEAGPRCQALARETFDYWMIRRPRDDANVNLSSAIRKGLQESAIKCLLEHPTQFEDTWDFSQLVERVNDVAMLNILLEAGLTIETLNNNEILVITLNRLCRQEGLEKKEIEELTLFAQFLLKVGVDPNPFWHVLPEQNPGCYESRMIFDLVRRMPRRIFESLLPKLVDAGLDVNSLELCANDWAQIRTPLEVAYLRQSEDEDFRDWHHSVRALIFNGAVVTSQTEKMLNEFSHSHCFDKLQRYMRIYREVSNNLTVLRIRLLAEIFPRDVLSIVHSCFDLVPEIREMCYQIEQKDILHPLPTLNDV